MDIYISDIKSDGNHPRATYPGEVGKALGQTENLSDLEREDLEEILVGLVKEVDSLHKRIEDLIETNNLYHEL